LACMRPDHVLFNHDLGGTNSPGKGGQLLLDNYGPTCSSSAEISVGHMSSKSNYSYGRSGWYVRVAHTSSGGDPPSNAFTCVSLYVNSPEHNEIAICWPPLNTSEVHLNYWVGDTIDNDKDHQKKLNLGFDAAKEFALYEAEWTPSSLRFYINGKLVWDLSGEAGVSLPWEPMSHRLIIRPNNDPSDYLGDAQMSLGYVFFEPF
jgi:endo-1,3-1,4-beta-glycanase ExoK